MKTILLLAGALAVAAMPLGATDAPKPDESSTAVARVNGRAITRAELDQALGALRAQFRAYGRTIPDEQLPAIQYDLLQQMIIHEIVLQEARGHEPKDLDEQVKTQFAAVKQQLGSDEEFAKVLQEMKLTTDQYQRRLRDDLLVRARIRQVAEEQTKVSADEVKAFYDANRDRMKLPERVQASHILIQVPAGATDEVRKQKRIEIESVQTLLKGGEKFADMARKYSEDKMSAVNGGDLGTFGRGDMVPEFEAVAFATKTGEISEIITTRFGYHLLTVTGHWPASERSFEDAKTDIENYLRQTKGEDATGHHVRTLREKAKVEILLPQPAPPAPAQPSGAAAPTKPRPTVETPPVAAPSR